MQQCYLSDVFIEQELPLTSSRISNCLPTTHIFLIDLDRPTAPSASATPQHTTETDALASVPPCSSQAYTPQTWLPRLPHPRPSARPYQRNTSESPFSCFANSLWQYRGALVAWQGRRGRRRWHVGELRAGSGVFPLRSRRTLWRCGLGVGVLWRQSQEWMRTCFSWWKCVLNKWTCEISIGCACNGLWLRKRCCSACIYVHF